MIRSKMRFTLASVLLACGILCSYTAHAAAPRTNVVLIITDDMGFSDLGCYGGEIDTPNIDSLARHGIKFSQFYNCGKCEPSRAALMTGHQFWTHDENVAVRRTARISVK